MIDHKEAMKIIKRVVWNEKGNRSGYINDPDDPGGETFCGISRNNHPFWEGWKFVDTIKQYDDFEKVLKKHAELNQMVYDFYYEEYYKGWVEGIADPRIRFLAMDFKVHSGGNGIKCIQNAVNRYYRQSLIKVDGALGKNTLDALLKIRKVDHFLSICLAVRAGFFINCRRSWKYLGGWMKRQNNNEKFLEEKDEA